MVIFRRLLVVVSIVFAAHPALAAAPSEVTRHADAEARGQVIEAAGTAARAEVVTFGTSLAERLRGTPPGQRVRVVGLVHGLKSIGGPYIFCSIATARQLLRLRPDQTTYLLARCRTPEDARAVVQRLETLWISISGSFDLRLLEVLRPLPLARCIVRVSSSLLPATDFASWPGLELVDEYAPVHDAFREWDLLIGRE